MAAGPRRATLPHAVHAVIFDMDGTLFDSEILYQRGLVEAGRAFGLAIGADFAMRTVGASWAATRQLLHEEFGHICHPDRLIAHWKAAVETLCSQALALKPGVLALLDLLMRLDLPCAIATSGYHHDVARNLRAAGLAERFDVVIAHGDYAAPKPAPDPYLCAAQRLAVSPIHCLAIEDSAHGVRSAQAAGMMTVMIPDLIQPDEALRALCTHVARDMHAVCDMLR